MLNFFILYRMSQPEPIKKKTWEAFLVPVKKGKEFEQNISEMLHDFFNEEGKVWFLVFYR